MSFQPQHSVQRGIHRLLMAPQDVPVRDPVPWSDPPIQISFASQWHQMLFAEYKEFLDEAIDIAEQWWDGMIQAAVNRGLSQVDATREVQSKVFAGPAARGEVVWTVRTFWLKCQALNREMQPNERVPPQVLLLSWLVDEGRDSWINTLTGMPYWPIGLSEQGDWE